MKNQATSPGTTVSSSAEHFDAHTASIPEVIASAEDPEVIPPGPAPPIDTGWPIFDLQQIVGLPFFLLKRRYGEIWEVDDEETKTVARAWKPILDKYLPLEETAIGTAVLVTLAIVGPRVLMTDWQQGKKTAGKKPTPPASTKTAASTESPVSSEKENPANPPEWGVFSKP